MAHYYLFSTPLAILTSGHFVFQYTPAKMEISRRENRCLLRLRNATIDEAAEYRCEVDGDVTTCQMTVDGKSISNHIHSIYLFTYVRVLVRIVEW